jgi:hypothetical protein
VLRFAGPRDWRYSEVREGTFNVILMAMADADECGEYRATAL